MLFNLVYQFTDAYNYWGEENAPIDKITYDNCLRFLYSQLTSDLQLEFILNSNRTVSINWESIKNVASLEIGKTRYSFYAQNGKNITIHEDGDATNIPTNIISSAILKLTTEEK